MLSVLAVSMMSSKRCLVKVVTLMDEIRSLVVGLVVLFDAPPLKGSDGCGLGWWLLLLSLDLRLKL